MNLPCLIALPVNYHPSVTVHLAASAGYLWGIPAHQDAWKALARDQGGRGLYMRFCHHLETDSIHLLDEAMKLLPEVGCHIMGQALGLDVPAADMVDLVRHFLSLWVCTKSCDWG